MVHAVEFVNGSARYRNRFVRTEAYGLEPRRRPAVTASWRTRRTTRRATGAPALQGFRQHRHHLPQRQAAGDVYLCGAPYALEPTSLDTLGAEDFAGTLDGDMMAHPKVDERTGELFWFDYGPSSPYMRYGVVGASGRVEHVVPIELAGPRLPMTWPSPSTTPS